MNFDKRIISNFIKSDNVFEFILLIYIFISIFNFQILSQKLFIYFFFIVYMIFFFIFNSDKFFNIKKDKIIIIFFIYLFLNQLNHYFQNKEYESIYNLELFKILFNIIIFIILSNIKKNWINFFEKLFHILCLLLILILLQNLFLKEHLLITSNIFFNYQIYTYDYDSKNFISILLNIFLFFLNYNFIKKKNYFYFFIVISLSIIFTYSRAGYYLYILNLIYLFFIGNRNIKINSFIILLILSSVFWNDFSKDYYMEKKAYSQNVEKKDFFNKEWFNRDGNSLRSKYYFNTLNNTKENFLFGNGINSFKIENKILYKDGKVKRYPDPHSTWLLLLYETGFVGLIIYMIAIFKNKINFLKSKNLALKINFFYFFTLIFFCSIFINVITSPVIWFLYSMRLNLKNE